MVLLTVSGSFTVLCTCVHACLGPATLPQAGPHSLSQELPSLLPHQWVVLQSDRFHGAIGN